VLDEPTGGQLCPTVSDNVCGQDRRQFALLTDHGNFPRFLQRIVESAERLDNRRI